MHLRNISVAWFQMVQDEVVGLGTPALKGTKMFVLAFVLELEREKEGRKK